MTDLIRIEERDGIQTVNARELHGFLEVETRFNDWIKNRIERYGFEEEQDFILLTEKLVSGNNANCKSYYISIDMAKELSMVENNAKGKEARQYFISVEKEARRKQLKASPLDILKQQIAMLEEHENRLLQIESKLETSQQDFYTVAGFASLRGLKVDLTKANMFGRKAAKLSKEYGYEIGRASDPRFGTVNTYHVDILSEIFN
jgi:phage anti-repressor protein